MAFRQNVEVKLGLELVGILIDPLLYFISYLDFYRKDVLIFFVIL